MRTAIALIPTVARSPHWAELARTDGHGHSLHLAVRIVGALGAIGVIGTGVALILLSGLGAGPGDVFIGALASHLPVSHGMISSTFALSILAGAMALGARPGPATFLAVAGVGPMIDVTLSRAEQLSFVPGPLALAAGMILVALGVATLCHASLGLGGFEMLVERLSGRLGISVPALRIALELLIGTVGIALGGRLGVGTVAVALALGPMIAVATAGLRVALGPFADADRTPPVVRFSRL